MKMWAKIRSIQPRDVQDRAIKTVGRFSPYVAKFLSDMVACQGALNEFRKLREKREREILFKYWLESAETRVENAKKAVEFNYKSRPMSTGPKMDEYLRREKDLQAAVEDEVTKLEQEKVTNNERIKQLELLGAQSEPYHLFVNSMHFGYIFLAGLVTVFIFSISWFRGRNPASHAHVKTIESKIDELQRSLSSIAPSGSSITGAHIEKLDKKMDDIQNTLMATTATISTSSSAGIERKDGTQSTIVGGDAESPQPHYNHQAQIGEPNAVSLQGSRVVEWRDYISVLNLLVALLQLFLAVYRR